MVVNIDDLETKILDAPAQPAHVAATKADMADTARRCLQSLNAARADEYHSWVEVGMALHAAGCDVEDWDNWSQQSQRYEVGVCQKKWQSFKSKSNGLTVASLIQWAREDDPNFELTRKSRGEKAAPVPDCGFVPRTDSGNGERMARQHGRKLRHCMESKKWLAWDGRRWSKETGPTEARRLALHTARSIKDEAERQPTEAGQQEVLKFALKSEARRGLDDMLNEARYCEPLTAYSKDFDSDPMTLNAMNGAIDLRTGKLEPHRPENMITKLSPCYYDPDAKLPIWDQFIYKAAGGDPAMMEFLQIAVGYTLTGLTDEEKLFFVHGPAASGKSTFLEAVKATLGDYAATADFESFIQKPGSGGIRNDIARLEGARLVASIEVDDGKKLAEGLVKMVTGSDTITARYLYQESFEFKPAFKLWLAANHAPKVRDDDAAMWRRILRIPFEVVIPIEERDPQIKKILTNPTKAGTAILAWAVRGCLLWQERGLVIPDCIQAATASYREDMDPLRDFFDDCCIFQESAIVPVSDLRKHYDQWASSCGIKWTIGPREFNKRVREKGAKIEPKWINGRSQKCWLGIKLQDIQ